MSKFNPFQEMDQSIRTGGKDRPRDPLDVKELLTDNSRKAVITPEGELKLQHGPMKEAAGVELMKERYWGADSSYRAMFDRQLAIETRAMRARFPEFELRRAESDLLRHGWTVAQVGQMFWMGAVRTYGGTRYLVCVVYPPNYPFGEVRSFVLEPFLPSTEHRFADGHLCLYGHEGAGEGFESGKSTAVTVVAWTSAWLHAYEIWRKSGRWPTIGESDAAANS